MDQWNGTTWSLMPTYDPIESEFSGVSCLSAQPCFGVGKYVTSSDSGSWNNTLIYKWNSP